MASLEVLKSQAGEIPDNTCPDIDAILADLGSVIKGLEYIHRTRQGYGIEDLRRIIDDDVIKKNVSVHKESLGQALKEIMDIFGYKVTPIE